MTYTTEFLKVTMGNTQCFGTMCLGPTGKHRIREQLVLFEASTHLLTFVSFAFGREYDPTDRVNPKAQLDPRTGKSYEHAMAKAE